MFPDTRDMTRDSLPDLTAAASALPHAGSGRHLAVDFLAAPASDSAAIDAVAAQMTGCDPGDS